MLVLFMSNQGSVYRTERLIIDILLLFWSHWRSRYFGGLNVPYKFQSLPETTHHSLLSEEFLSFLYVNFNVWNHLSQFLCLTRKRASSLLRTKRKTQNIKNSYLLLPSFSVHRTLCFWSPNYATVFERVSTRAREAMLGEGMRDISCITANPFFPITIGMHN
jgi:hypothetical protein